MYEDHDVFEPPTNRDVSIWRYLDLAKFVSMLEAKALHFARVDVMEDVFEGSIGEATFQDRRQNWFGDMSDDTFEAFNSQWSDANKRILRDYAYLNCWHMSEHESVAMWKIYQSGESQGIAIRSTYRRLVDSITDDRTVYVGTVSYIDFDTEVIPHSNNFYPIVHKREAYDYEREIRAVHHINWAAQDLNDPQKAGWAPLGPAVMPISVDLDTLVERIYISPNARDWFAQVVRDVLARYGKAWPVEYSSIDGEPIF